MKINLKDYVQIYPMLDEKFCKKIFHSLKTELFDLQHFRSAGNKIEHNDTDPKCSGPDKHIDIETYNHIMDQYYCVLEKYVNELSFPWFNVWNGYTTPKFNLYEQGTGMKTHWDHINSIFEDNPRSIPTLSMITTLHNNCEGGEFYLFENTKYNINVGEVIIFPSNFLYPHKVTNITKGKRVTMVSWVY